MGDIEQYRSQVSPELPKGPSPFQLLSRFTLPDTRVEQAVTEGIGTLGDRIAEMAIKASAADQAEEVARARAQYFSTMTDWTLNLTQSDIDPKEYRNEFSRRSNELAGDISKGFRYGDSLEQFSTWRLEQDVPLLGQTTKQQLNAMNDRFGATLQKDLGILKNNPAYLATVLRNIQEAERVIGKTAAETLRQNAMKLADVSQAMVDGRKIGPAAMAERFKSAPGLYGSLDPEDQQRILIDLDREKKVRQQELDDEDEQKDNHFANDVLLRAKTSADLLKGRKELEASPFHSGDLTRKWMALFTPADPADAKAWSQLPPDDATFNQFAILKTAVRFARLLPKDTVYGRYAGKVPPSGFAREWIQGRQKQMGSAYDSEREAIDDLESEQFKYVDQQIEDVAKSDGWKRKHPDAIESQQALGALRDRIHTYIDTENPNKQALSAAIWANTFTTTKPVTEDTATTAQGAELTLRLWNGQLPQWADQGAQQNQVESIANGQRLKFTGRFGIKPEDLPRISIEQVRAGQEGYGFFPNGVPVFSFNGATYSYVPSDYDPKKKPEEQTLKSKDLKLKVFKGGRWLDPPKPVIDTSGPTSFSAEDLGNKDRNDLVNARADAVKKIAAAENYITEQTQAVKSNPMLKPSLRLKKNELDMYKRDLANIEAAIQQLGVRQ